MAAKRKTGTGKYLVLLILVGTGVYSYFNSREIYTFWMRAYYEKVRGQSAGMLARNAREMYDAKRYRQTVEYLRPLIMVYPENREFLKINGMALLKLGEARGGADAILSATDGEAMPEKLLEETVRALYENRRYRDIIALFKTNHPGDNPKLLYHYGVSLYVTGKSHEAIQQFKKAIGEGRNDQKVYLFLGLAYDKTGDTRRALPFLKRAFDMNEHDRDAARSLMVAYRKLGRNEEAAKILRRTQ